MPAEASKRNSPWRLLLLAVIVLLSRLPFISAGHGNDDDAWRAALAANQIAATGHYFVSRSPGYPVQEIVCALICQGGPVMMNGLTAIFSAVAVVFFALSFKLLTKRDYFLTGLAFAFVPVIYINSTTSLDYVWALTFILGSLYFILVRKPLLAGVLLGVAIGCRITSVLMFLPLSLLMLQPEGFIKPNLTSILKFVLAGCVIGGIAFAPVVLTYGPGIFKYYSLGYPPLPLVLKGATLDVWGIIGLIGIIVAIVLFLFGPARSRKAASSSAAKNRPILVLCISAIVLYLLSYLRLPHEAGYLIPALPFVLILLAEMLQRKIFIWVCVALIASPFLLDFNWWNYPDYVTGIKRSRPEKVLFLPGSIFIDHARRLEEPRYQTQAYLISLHLPMKSVIVVGIYLSKIPPAFQDCPKFVSFLNADQLRDYRSRGYAIYYMLGLREQNLKEFGIDLAAGGASPLPPSY